MWVIWWILTVFSLYFLAFLMSLPSCLISVWMFCPALIPFWWRWRWFGHLQSLSEGKIQKPNAWPSIFRVNLQIKWLLVSVEFVLNHITYAVRGVFRVWKSRTSLATSCSCNYLDKPPCYWHDSRVKKVCYLFIANYVTAKTRLGLIWGLTFTKIKLKANYTQFVQVV